MNHGNNITPCHANRASQIWTTQLQETAGDEQKQGEFDDKIPLKNELTRIPVEKDGQQY